MSLFIVSKIERREVNMWWFGKGKDEQIADLKERIDMLETEILHQPFLLLA